MSPKDTHISNPLPPHAEKAPASPSDGRLDPVSASTSVQVGVPTTWQRTVRSELIKLRSLRSNMWLLGVATAFLLLLGPIQVLGSVLGGSEATIDTSARAVETAVTGGPTATLLLGVLGVLVVSGEYAPRSIRTTFMTVPRRGVVVAAKAAALGLLTIVTGAAAVAGAVTASLLLLARGDLEVSWTSPHVLRVAAGMVWYLAGWGSLGLVAGWVTRSKIGGAALLMTVMLLLAPVLGLVPGRLGEILVALLPSSAGAAMVSAQPSVTQLAGITVGTPTFGFVVWTCYLVLLTALAAVAVSRRDA